MIDREEAKKCVGAGWHSLINEAFDLIEKERVVVTQVKEKYGELRIYTDSKDDSFIDKIHDIEDRSATVCEDCSTPTSPKRCGWWVYTLCDSCLSNYV